MKKSSKKVRLHPDWRLVEAVWHQGHLRFVYKCGRCGVTVLNGQPFSEVQGAEECSPK